MNSRAVRASLATTPMPVDRPVATSRIPPFTEHLGEKDVLWCDPLSRISIAEAMPAALVPGTRDRLAARATALLAAHGWARAAAAHLPVHHALRERVHAWDALPHPLARRPRRRLTTDPLWMQLPQSRLKVGIASCTSSMPRQDCCRSDRPAWRHARHRDADRQMCPEWGSGRWRKSGRARMPRIG